MAEKKAPTPTLPRAGREKSMPLGQHTEIVIRGAREHNLKDIDLTIPRDKLVVFTGLSGSGKSSLAFDTIYAEGQRRYVESLSSYARQFLGQMDKPDVDQIDGLSPAISIDQKGTSHNPRSTVGTVTEIYDYLRLMYARIGHPHCPISGHEITRQTTEQIADKVMELPQGSRIMILAPVVRDRKGEHHDVLSEARKAGFVRARVDGNLYELTERITLDKNKKHNVEIVVDRLVIEKEGISRLRESVETAAKINPRIHLIAGGLHLVVAKDDEIDKIATTLRDTFKVGYVAPGHCTGEPTFAALRKAFGDRYLYAGLGTVLALGAKPRAVAENAAPPPRTLDEADLEAYRTLLAATDDEEHPRLALGR